MPTLQFKGKSLVWNHHLSVPFHTLDDVNDLDFQPEKGEGNLIIEGDNLVALKALIPEYQGKIKCIYIDPPYNTGNEGWVYNDKVNSPMISEWLGNVVGSDDLNKHDKWLCMMVPRLKLLRDLLSDDGVMFISIDDNEVHHLRQIMNEIFGEENFVAELIWRKKAGGGNDSQDIAVEHEYVLLFRKLNNGIFKIPLDEENLKKYKFKDKKFETHGTYLLKDLNDPSLSDSNGLHFDIKCPDSSILSGSLNQWKCNEKTFNERLSDNRIEFKKNKDGIWKVFYKIYLNEEKGILKIDSNGNITSRGKNQVSILYNIALNSDGNNDLKNLFNGDYPFDYPKPVNLLKQLIKFSSNSNDIILDSFAGSGTTMHAVMALNKEDGGNRKCIMIQMPENNEKEPENNIAKDITRERVKRAIEKYEFESGFGYKRVGVRIRAEEFFEGKLPEYKQFAEYIYFLATGKLDKTEISIDKSLYYVGGNKKEDVYLIYEKDNEQNERLALNLTLVNKMLVKSGTKKKIVYAPVCYLDDEFMTEFNFEFVNIPFNLFERTV